MAQKISAYSKTAVCFAKSAISRTILTDQMTDYSYDIETFGKCFETEEQKKAMSDFVSKRKNA
jgi:enoyl-CoA hydratase